MKRSIKNEHLLIVTFVLVGTLVAGLFVSVYDTNQNLNSATERIFTLENASGIQKKQVLTEVSELGERVQSIDGHVHRLINQGVGAHGGLSKVGVSALSDTIKNYYNDNYVFHTSDSIVYQVSPYGYPYADEKGVVLKSIALPIKSLEQNFVVNPMKEFEMSGKTKNGSNLRIAYSWPGRIFNIGGEVVSYGQAILDGEVCSERLLKDFYNITITIDDGNGNNLPIDCDDVEEVSVRTELKGRARVVVLKHPTMIFNRYVRHVVFFIEGKFDSVRAIVFQFLTDHRMSNRVHLEDPEIKAFLEEYPRFMAENAVLADFSSGSTNFAGEIFGK